MTKTELPENDVEWTFAPLLTIFGVAVVLFDPRLWERLLVGAGLLAFAAVWWWMLWELYAHPERWRSTGAGGRI